MSNWLFFNCPKCKMLYHFVKAQAGPESVDGEIGCCHCGEPLPGREGQYVLKYFLLRDTGHQERYALA
jgi:hypothetical protein